MSDTSPENRLLQLTDVHAGYGETKILNGISLSVKKGEVVALIGRNGAGKTTTLQTILGHLTPSHGTIRYGDTEITSLEAAKTAQLGITIVPEERQIFPGLTVRENAEVSRIGKGDRDGWDIDNALSIFENLGTKGDQLGSTLSGGEQQMLAISRALVSGPELLILDEPTEGLAPQIVTEVAEIIADLKAQGLTILLVEQNVEVAVDLADRVYVIDRGRIVFEGTAAEFESNEEIKQQHLGVSN